MQINKHYDSDREKERERENEEPPIHHDAFDFIYNRPRMVWLFSTYLFFRSTLKTGIKAF